MLKIGYNEKGLEINASSPECVAMKVGEVYKLLDSAPPLDMGFLYNPRVDKIDRKYFKWRTAKPLAFRYYIEFLKTGDRGKFLLADRSM